MKIADITPDPKNANKGTQRGRSMLERSLRNLGAGRSILVDKNNVTIAGNKTLEVAAELNLKIKEIETDGNELIVVRRTDLDLLKDPKAKELAIADNRVSEVSLAWDAPMLEAQGVDLGSWFLPYELAGIGLGNPPNDPNEQWKGMPECENQDLSAWKSIRVNFNSPESLQAFAKLLEQPLTENTRSIWYPAAEIGRTADKVYKSES